MESIDLKLENVVKHTITGDTVIVKEITGKFIKVLTPTLRIKKIDVKDLEGIPLTEMILRQYQFEKGDEMDDQRTWNNHIVLHQDTWEKDRPFMYATYVRGDGSYKGGSIIEFEHKLQNLFYCLTNTVAIKIQLPPEVIKLDVSSWRITDKFPCPVCQKKLSSINNYFCEKDNLKIMPVMHFSFNKK